MPLSRLQTLLDNRYWAQARKEVDHLLATELPPADKARVFRCGGFAALQCGEYFAAIEMGNRAIDLATESGDGETAVDARFTLGTAFLFVGDYPVAAQHLVQFIDTASAFPGLTSTIPHAHFNMGVLAEYRQDYHDAVAAYELALGIWLQAGATKQVVRCYRHLAWVHLLLAQADLALPYLNRIEMQLRVRDDPEYRFWLLIDKAFYNRLVGNLSDSISLCEEVFAQAGMPGLNDDHLTEAAWVTGENSLDVGRTYEAKIFADLALTYATKANWPFMMNRACDLRRRALEAEEQQTMED